MSTAVSTPPRHPTAGPGAPRVSTDNPGSPNIKPAAALSDDHARRHVWRRPELQSLADFGRATVDRTVYQFSKTHRRHLDHNDDRNFNCWRARRVSSICCRA
jgi:hypothetical protein